MSRRSIEDAREFFADPSQQIFGATPDTLPEDDCVQYWIDGPLCAVFHPAPWPDVWMAHYALKPEGKGRGVEPAKRLLRAFCEAEKPVRIVGWTQASNRLAVAFARRCGFVVDGVLPLESGDVLMQGYEPCQLEQ